MTTNARIYKPSKSAMQSGRNARDQWVLEYETQTPRRPEPLMGWVSSGDTLGQVRMRFETKEKAIAFAQAKGMHVDVEEIAPRVVSPKSYLDNFKYIPPDESK